jgi:LPS export ABC transporter protein LptC
MIQISKKITKYVKSEILIIGMLIMIALGLKQIPTQKSYNNKNPGEHQNRVISFQSQAEGIQSTFYDSSGNIIYRINATKQTQLSNSKIAMTLPKIMIYNCGIQTWRITSQKASLEKSESLLTNKSIAGIQFSSGVILEELSGMTTALTVTTEELYFDSIQKTVSTKLEASVAGYQINHTAKGLFADLENNNLEFLSKNRGAHANSSF